MANKYLNNSHITVAACRFTVQPDGAIQLTPAGAFRARDGRPEKVSAWYINDETAPKVIARLKSHIDDIVIDYEHQTLLAEENGKPAPASGWFKGADVEWRPGKGLFVTPEWTEAAKAHIKAGEYRYISPVLVHDKNTGEILDIQMAALTNYAAIDGMQALEASAALRYSQSTNTKEPSMEELLKLFGLSPNASEDEAVAALKALQTTNTNLQQQLDEQSVALKAGHKPDPSKYVPIDAVTALQEEVAALKASGVKAETDDIVDTALSDGRLSPALEDWARELGQSDITALKAYVENSPAITALKATQTAGVAPVSTNGLTDEENWVANQLGQSSDDFTS